MITDKIEAYLNEGLAGSSRHIINKIEDFQLDIYDFIMGVDPRDKNFKAIDTLYNKIQKDLNTLSDLAEKL